MTAAVIRRLIEKESYVEEGTFRKSYFRKKNASVPNYPKMTLNATGSKVPHTGSTSTPCRVGHTHAPFPDD